MSQIGAARWVCGAASLLSFGLAGAAQAEPARLFRLPAEPVDTALVRFGVQGGVSVGGFPTPGCAGRSHAVLGLFKPSEALRRLLPEGCASTRVDARAFRILGQRSPLAAPRPATPVALPPTAIELAELVVTAEKRTEPLRGSPFAVTALTGDDADRLGAQSFADLALQVPAVAETNLGPGRNKLFIRGLSDGTFTGRTQSTVGLYFDDTPISYNAPDPDLRLTDIARIEVLRGPQGTLYGSGSIGGIVRILAQAPDPTGYAAWVQGEGVMNEHKDRSFGGEAMANIPLLGGRGAIRAVGYVEGLAGYLDNPILGVEDVNHGRRRGGRVSGLVNLDGWQVRAGWIRQDILTADSQYTQGGGTLNRDVRVREPHDNDFTQYSASLHRQGSTYGVRISAAYIDHDLSTRYDATGAFDLPPSQVAAFDETQRVELQVAEALVTTTDSARFRWLVGAFGSSALEKSSGVLDARIAGGAARSLYDRRDRLTEAAVFGEVAYDITPRLTATLGGRLFATQVRTRASGFEIAASPLPDLDAHLSDRGFSPKVRLSYAVSPDVVFYVQAQDGYRAGGFNVPAAADGMAAGPAITSFRPDRLRSYEAGGEARFFDGAFTLRAATFKAIWKNVQTDQFRASGLPLTLNIGDGSNLGTEFEMVWRPDRHWRLRINGLFNGPELTRADLTFPAKVDIGLPGVANRTGGVDLTYAFGISSSWRAELTAQAGYVGRSFLTFDGASASKMGDYAQGRVAASLESANWRVEAYIANVTDERGNTFAYGNPFSRSRAVQATPLPPRAYGLALRRHF
ncbi:MAG: TonB-dependent receptor [Phenylobacterium sp.]|uniref:TonB-dependent receptor n=1 Tax=Phenylobacterium sp. TaxID=1871053 RepID=UPI0025FD9958|nr:TonB-dependent receptor [Phenylobacterium sp.]MBT9470821.1 TonB-dependent receptor [Phenylobacterium sp.]